MTNHIRRIMIADDHAVIRRGIRGLLETRPAFQIVAEASDGRMALEQARETRPSIAIIDYALSELNGVDLTYALKREMPHLEVMFFTMHDREDLILSALQAGAKGYVRKSDPEQQILDAIDSLSLHHTYLTSSVSEKVLEQLADTAKADHPTLTHREREVVQLIAEGNINKQVAQILRVSVKTIETHRAAAMVKLKLRNTAQLVRYALRNKLVEA